jgi:hypothetical protein
MVPLDTAPTLVDEIRELVPVVAGTRILGASLVMDLSLSDGPMASHNINYVYYWLQDSVASPQKILDKLVNFYTSDFGDAHSAFRVMITCAVRRYGFLLRTLPPSVCRPYLATFDSVVRYVVFRIFGVSREIWNIKLIAPHANSLCPRSLGASTRRVACARCRARPLCAIRRDPH